MFIPDHKHLIVNANITKPILEPRVLKVWLNGLVKLIGMSVFFGPNAKVCSEPGNEGVTGIVGLESSHISYHEWTAVEEPYVRIDLYSCKEFSIPTVLNKIITDLRPTTLEYQFIDRNKELKVIEQDKIQLNKGFLPGFHA